jgi:hypothetical protein
MPRKFSLLQAELEHFFIKTQMILSRILVHDGFVAQT